MHFTKAALAAAVLICARLACADTPTGTQWPGSLDTDTQLPKRFNMDTAVSPPHCTGATADDCIVHAQDYNTVASAVRAIETAMGTDATWGTVSVLTRLGLKVQASSNNFFSGDQTFKAIDNVLVVNDYPGTEIGDRIAAAVADCTTRFGSDWCRIVLRPSPGSEQVALSPAPSGNGYPVNLTTITINRSKTELDCQGAHLTATSSLTASVIMLNADPTYLGGSELTDIAVRNCLIDDTAQTDNTVNTGTSMLGVIAAYRIDRLQLVNITVLDSMGPAVVTKRVRGVVRDIQVFTTRSAASNPVDPTGIILSGEGFGSSTGRPTQASNLLVDSSAGAGIQLIVGVEAAGVAVKNAASPCLLIGGAATQGWIALSNFDFEGCATAAATETGSIDDAPAAGAQLKDVDLHDGLIRYSTWVGIRMIATPTSSNIRLKNLAIEGFYSYGMRVSNFVGSQIVSNLISGSSASYHGTGLAVGGTLTGNLLIGHNQFLGTSAHYYGDGIALTVPASSVWTGIQVLGNNVSTWGGAGIHVTATGPPFVGGGYSAQRIAISNNSIYDNCHVLSPCYEIMMETTNVSAAIDDVLIAGNQGGDDTHAPFGQVDHGQVTRLVLNDNAFSGLTINLAQAGVIYEGLTREAYGSGPFANRLYNFAPQSVRAINLSGGSLGPGTAVCIADNGGGWPGFTTCTDSSTAWLGILADTVDNNAYGPVVTHGPISAKCGGTIAAGDLLEVTSSGTVRKPTSPAVGTIVGRAYSACGSSCGDCNADGVFSAGEVTTCNNIALGTQPLSDCTACDCNADGELTSYDMIILRINASLGVSNALVQVGG